MQRILSLLARSRSVCDISASRAMLRAFFLFRAVQGQPSDAGIFIDVGGDVFKIIHCNSPWV
jgi:hypothetical protein